MEISELQNALNKFREEKKIIGFVPTMGALHQGHLSLIERCKAECDITVASIFVNPTQFNQKSDYDKYPRIPEVDLKMLEEAACDLVFLPSESEIYPQEDTRIFDFGNLDKVLEGACRPGHFNGVAQVVSRLFEIVQPNKAFFGLKDLQQVAIIRKMVEQLNLKVQICEAPIIRETDGLAMSSRNMLLNKEQRTASIAISQALFQSQKQAKENIPFEEIKRVAIERINSEQELKTEYFEIVDGRTFVPLTSNDTSKEIYACAAVWAGTVRLIDNIRLN